MFIANRSDSVVHDSDPEKLPFADWLVRDLTDAYPDTLAVLAPLGIDLCCGGSRTLREALAAHGIDGAAVYPAIAAVAASADGAGHLAQRHPKP